MSVEFSISLKTEVTAESVESPQLAAAAAAGFKNFEWCRDLVSEPILYDKPLADTLLSLTQRYGIRMGSIHGFASTPAGTTYTKEICLAANINRLEFLDRMGGQVLVIHLPLKDHPDIDTAVGEAAEILAGLWPTCKRTGARIAVENLFQPNQFGVEFFDRLLERFPPDFLGFCYDSGHALISGWTDVLDSYGERLIATHLADNDGKEDLHWVPGKGGVDWSTVIPTVKRSALCRADGKRSEPGPVGLEVRLPKTEPIDTVVQDSYRAITELWDKHG